MLMNFAVQQRLNLPKPRIHEFFSNSARFRNHDPDKNIALAILAFSRLEKTLKNPRLLRMCVPLKRYLYGVHATQLIVWFLSAQQHPSDVFMYTPWLS